MKFMWTLITIGVIVLVGAGTVLLKKKKDEDLGEELSQIVETTDAKSWDMPVLDGTSEAEDLGFDLSRFPGMER